MGWFVALGIDVNRDYLAFGWLTNDADYVASALGAWGAYPLTSWLFEEHVRFGGIQRRAAFNIAIRAVKIYAGDPPGGARGGLDPQPRALSAGPPRDDQKREDTRGDEAAENWEGHQVPPPLKAPPGALYAYMEEVFRRFGRVDGFAALGTPALTAAFPVPPARAPAFLPHVGA